MKTLFKETLGNISHSVSKTLVTGYSFFSWLVRDSLFFEWG